jgi:shikimate kinase
VPAEQSNIRVVALTGFMAAGKSTVGVALAQLLGWKFVDLDSEVENRTQQPISSIFAQQGEAQFRKFEADALQSILESITASAVIALGGGTFVQPQNAALLQSRSVQVVFLELPLEQLLQRCRPCTESDRPLAQDEEAMRTLYEQRLPSYRRAQLIVSADGKSPEEIARAIAEELRATI